MTTGAAASRPIDQHTQCCISISARPSNVGTRLHNAAYAALGLNFVYKAFAVSDLQGAIAGVRALGIRGCSVSMPFKESVITHLDALDDAAARARAVNTVVNEDGRLVGYNTDVDGAVAALASLEPRPEDQVLLLGAGGAARAVVLALARLGLEKVRVAARDPERARPSISAVAPFEVIGWDARDDERPTLLINATPVGMAPDPDAVPVGDGPLSSARAVMDVVASPMESRLVARARALGKAVAPGYEMSLHQACRQFELYTGHAAPRQVMRAEILSLLSPVPGGASP